MESRPKIFRYTRCCVSYFIVVLIKRGVLHPSRSVFYSALGVLTSLHSTNSNYHYGLGTWNNKFVYFLFCLFCFITFFYSLQVLALKHHTSKISEFSDLHSLKTFGFRGEALSSLCTLGDLIIETRTKNESLGTHLVFDHSGVVKTERKIARQVGTTVTVEKLFSTLPVRSKDFSRNIRREYAKLVSLLNVRGPFHVLFKKSFFFFLILHSFEH